MDSLKTSIFFGIALIGSCKVREVGAVNKRTKQNRRVALFAAIKEGNCKKVSECLGKDGVSVCVTDEKGRTPFLCAIESELANKNASTPDDPTKFYEVLNFLVKKGSDVNVKNKSGESALVQVLKESHFSLLSCLLTMGKHPRIVLETGEALKVCKNNRECSEKKLEKLGPLRDLGDLAPRATEEFNKEEKYWNYWKNVEDQLISIPLFEAIDQGDVKRVQDLVEDRNQLDVKDWQGDPPLVRAVKKLLNKKTFNKEDDPAAQIVVTLVKHVENANAMDASDETPLTLAVARGRTDVFDFLLGFVPSIDVNGQNLPKRLLYYAIQSRRDPDKQELFLSMVEKLHSKKARLNPPKEASLNQLDPEDDSTPLMEAIELEAPSVVNFLLNRLSNEGLFVQRKRDNKTVFHLAVDNKQTDLFKRLLTRLKCADLERLSQLQDNDFGEYSRFIKVKRAELEWLKSQNL